MVAGKPWIKFGSPELVPPKLLLVSLVPQMDIALLSHCRVRILISLTV